LNHFDGHHIATFAHIAVVPAIDDAIGAFAQHVLQQLKKKKSVKCEKTKEKETTQLRNRMYIVANDLLLMRCRF
jgi:hypothetical protein